MIFFGPSGEMLLNPDKELSELVSQANKLQLSPLALPGYADKKNIAESSKNTGLQWIPQAQSSVVI